MFIVGRRTLTLTSIQKECIDLECFMNWFSCLSKGPFGIHGKNKVYFIKIMEVIWVMKEHCKTKTGTWLQC